MHETPSNTCLCMKSVISPNSWKNQDGRGAFAVAAGWPQQRSCRLGQKRERPKGRCVCWAAWLIAMQPRLRQGQQPLRSKSCKAQGHTAPSHHFEGSAAAAQASRLMCLQSASTGNGFNGARGAQELCAYEPRALMRSRGALGVRILLGVWMCEYLVVHSNCIMCRS